MTITTKHKFVSAKGDGTDATLVRPSNWNDDHNINLAANKLMGRLTAGTGLVEEIPLSTYFSTLLNAADYNALAALLGLPTTGDAKLTYKTTADTGWIMANDGSIGNASSGATTRANADTQALFVFFYNGFSDAVCPVQTSAGGATTRVAQGTATVAYAANCRMVIPKVLGRALLFSGTGAGLTNRPLATTGGEENHTLINAESPKHTHTATGWTLSSTSVSGSPTGTTSTTLTSKTTGFNDTTHYHNTDITNLGTTGSAAIGYDLTHAHSGGASFGPWTSGGYVNSGYPNGNGLTYGGGANTGSSGNLDHAHQVDPPNTSSGADLGGSYGTGQHKHSMDGTYAGTCTINTWTGVTVTGTIGGTTDVMSVGDGAHNNMQPWTAWNIMIRL